jgi:Ca2+-binding RTX toxin-like protein
LTIFQVTVGLNAAQTDTGAIQALVGGVPGGQANVTAGANTLSFTLAWDETLDGDFPSSLSFQFTGAGGNSLTFTSISINGQSVSLGTYLDNTTINTGTQFGTVTIGAPIRHFFGRQEPDVGDPADIRANPGNVLGTDLGHPGDTTANVTIVPNVASPPAIEGSNGRDIIYGSDFADRVNAGDGDDSVAGNNGGDTLFGGAGNDMIAGGAGDDSIFGGLGDDLLFGNAGADLIQGQGGNNVLNGGDGDDTLVGGANNDILFGGADDDMLSGGNGNDALYGDDGADLLSGGNGIDTGWGGAGNDTLAGGAGNDTLYGDADDDMLSGGAGNDVLYGDDGTNVSADGADIIMGGTGVDIIRGGLGNDILLGEADVDSLYGQDGDDVLIGGAGADILDGGDGADILYGTSIDTATATALVAQGGRPDVSFGMSSNSFYKVVLGSFDYATAAAAAAADTLNGVAGHLVAITSAAEQATINELVAAAGGTGQFWMGGYDAGIWGEGVWMWTGGPESLQQFSNNAGAPVSGFFNYWQGGAPANSTGLEDYAALNSSNSGYWTANASTATFGYVIEWDGISFSADTGADLLTGGNGDDVVYGGNGSNTFDGGSGNDRLYGGSGDDLFKGGAGVDNYYGGGGTNTYDASTATGSVVITNYLGVLLLSTDDGYGAAETYLGISNITGGAFNDTIEGGSGNSVLIGNGGTDLLTYANAAAGVTVNLATTTAQATGGSGSDTISGFENLTGSGFADTLTGDTGVNVIDGGNGDDVIDGGDGTAVDTLDGGAGTNTLSYASLTGGSGVVVNLSTVSVSGGGGADSIASFLNIAGSTYSDVLTGDTGANVIAGGDGNDTLDGLAGIDVMSGGNGNDTLISDTGADTMTGDAGDDLFSMANGEFDAGETIDGGTGTDTISMFNATTVDYTTGVLAGLETLSGSTGVDTVTMSAAQWSAFTVIDLTGGATDKMVVLASGTANISGGSAPALSNTESATLSGSAGADTLTLTGAQLNALFGSAGTKLIDLLGGADTLNLSSTSTTLNGLTNGQIANLEAISAASAGAGVVITVSSQSEGFTITGSTFADTITGGSGADTITGGAGADTLDGGNGNDVFNVANGDFVSGDSITGGADTDTIVLTTVGATADFSLGTLASVETITATSGNDFVTVLATQYADVLSTINLGSAGTDTFRVYVSGTMDISAATAATVTGSGSIFGQLWGSGGDDTITMTGAQLDAILAGFVPALNMMGGTDTINLTSNSARLNVVATLGGGLGNSQIAGVEVISASAATAAVTLNMSLQSEGMTLTGGSGTDVITGGTGNDVIQGGAGTDTLTGGAGDDVIHPGGTAGAGNTEVVDGGAGVDTIDFSDITPVGGHSVYISWFGVSYIFDDGFGSDLYALSNFENVTGSSANDILDLARDTVNSIVAGGLGDDTLSGGGGNNTLDGGSGNDTASYGNTLGVTTGIVANLALGTGQVTNNGAYGGSGVDTLVGIEQLYGSAYNDTITGSSGNDILSGAAGNDTIDAGDGDDTVDGGTGNDILTGGSGTDTVSYGSVGGAVTFNLATTTAQNTGGAGTDTVSGFENITGSNSADTLTGNSNANTINGGGGNDTLIGAAGNDYLDGGAGTADIASYSTSTAGVTVNLTTGTASDGLGGTDTLVNIEGILGSAQADVLTGSAGNDTFFFSLGNDGIDGGAGTNTYDLSTAPGGVTVGYFGSIYLSAYSGHVTFLTNIQNINGSGFNDVIEGTTGNNVMTGGAGTDTLTYTTSTYDATAGVTVNLATTTAQNTGGAGTDTVSGFENLTGSGFADTLTGTTGANVVDGGANNDVLHGNGGNDVLTGGAGNDVIYSESTAATTVAAILAANSGIGLQYNAETGNFYRYINSGISTYAAARNEAAAATLSGVSGTAGDGHVLTINSADEFDFVRNTINISGGTWLGIGDQAAVNAYAGGGGAEGTWKYLEGPEAGTTFYTGSAARLGYFVNTSNFSGAMNNATNDYALMRGSDAWDDQDGGESNHRVIEWDGQLVFNGVTKDTVTIDGGAGADGLYAGDGKDVFLFMAATAGTGANADSIYNFNASVDVLDLSNLLTGYSGASNPNDFVFFKTVGSDTEVKVDTNGGGGMTESNYATYAIIKGLTGIDVDDWAHRDILAM